MKTQFLSLCLFLFFICPISAQEEVAVLDSQGNKLKEGSKYYVKSVIWGAGGGGLSLSNYSNEECSTTVTQESFDLNYGIPATFHPAAPSTDGTITLSKSLNVKFDPDYFSVPSCVNSTVWKVGRLDPYTRSFLITVEGMEGSPGCDTRSNWFKIEKGSIGYYFSFNPDDVCSSHGEIGIEGSDLTTFSAFGLRPLGLSPPGGFPFQVMFIKYDDPPNVIRNKAAAYTAQ